ncbi:MAG: hypothetical protein QOH21_3118 [Acidobacteriota bacterium]|jgi:hypothetical protein|nr:hypothetical protein [Acidobacteriota bacterium]
MPDAVLSGSLAAFKLPEVLTFLSTTRKSGTLTLTSAENAAYLFFDDGCLVYAGSNQEQFRLGYVLLRKKKISREQRDRIDALMLSDGGRFGQIAVQQGVLTETQLRDFLKIQVSEIVYDCFVWDGGTFAFAHENRLPSHAVTISIDLTNLIMEGARRIEEMEQCVRLLPDRNAVFRVVAAPRDEKITLTADEWKILFLINSSRTLEELCHDSEDEPFHVYRLVYGLLSNHLVEEVPRETVVHDDTDAGARTRAASAESGDATFRQASPVFGGESTVREADDDTSLLVSSEAKLSYHDVVRPTVAQLLVATGDVAGRVFPLVDSEYLIGRHRENTIQLADLGVSSFHARLYQGPEGYVLEDLKSRNGTWVNGTRVYHATLAHGDKVHVGATDLLYEVLMHPTVTQ